MKSASLGAVSVFLAGFLGCYTGAGIDVNAMPGAAGNVSTASGGGTSGLPCDVAQMLVANCASCHSSGPGNTVLTFDALTGPSRSDPTKTFAQLALERMKDTAKPMPPSGLLPPDQVAILETWIGAGMPKGTCAATEGAGGANFSGPSVCTSNTYWTHGNQESAMMHPGYACGTCHGSGQLSGTVYPTGHEPDDCYGASGSTVVITDANGIVYNLPVNGSGNFRTSMRRIATPYTAKVVSGTKVRPMMTPQTNGDCNACHSEGGAQGAPGRIVAP